MDLIDGLVGFSIFVIGHWMFRRRQASEHQPPSTDVEQRRLDWWKAHR